MMIKNKFNGYSGDGRRLYPGGGGAPTQTTAYQTNIPEYARPYVETMLGATQKQVFTGGVGPSGTFEPTGFRDYMPFGQTFQTDAQGNPMRDAQGRVLYTSTPMQAAQAAVAPLSPLQQQAMVGLGSYVQPQQGTAASQIAGSVAGRSAAGGYYSPLVAERFQLGRPQQVYSDSYTAPGVSQAYMSPYMQNVVQAQQREARRASEIARNQQQAQAVGAGAYGGSRQAIVEAERQRNLAQQLGDIQAQGLQGAYQQGMGQFNAEQAAYLQAQQANQQANLQAAIQNQQAQQAAQQMQEQSRQFGAGLGIQGYGQTLQAAQLLGEQGSREFQQDMAALQAKMQAGGMDQQQQQQVINQAIQNYGTQQQYPLMQLGVLSNMLRGLPMQAATSQMYQAPLSPISQAAGAIGTGLGLVQQYNQAFPGRKEGGVVKLAPGGIATGVQPGKLADMAEMMRDEDLQKKMQDQETDPATKEIFQSETMRRQKLRGMAGGGIVAFAGKKGSVVKDKAKTKEDIPLDTSNLPGKPVSDTYPEEFERGTAAGIMTSAPAAPDDSVPSTALSGLRNELGSLEAERKKTVPEMMQQQKQERQQLGIVDPTAERKQELADRKARIDKEAQEFAQGNLIMFLQRWGSIRGDALLAATTAGYEMVERSEANRKERSKMKDALDDAIANLNEAQYLRQLGDMEKAQARSDAAGKIYFDVALKLEEIDKRAEAASLSNETKLAIQELKTKIEKNPIPDQYGTDIIYKALVEHDNMPPNANTRRRAYELVQQLKPVVTAAGIATGPRYAGVALEGEKLTGVQLPEEQRKQKADYDKAYRREVNKVDDLIGAADKKDPSGKASQAIKDDIARKLLPGYKALTPSMVGLGGSAAPVAPPTKMENKSAPAKPDIANIEGAPAGSSVGSYVKGKGWEVKGKNGKLLGYAPE